MRKRNKWIALILGLTLSLSIVLTGCGGSTSGDTSSSGTASGQDDSTLVVGLTNDITSLDYAANYTISNFQVVNSINDSLLINDQNGQMQPNLCTSWEQVDALTYVYQIRDDVCFSDGTPMTVDDVVFSMNRVKDPATASEFNWAYANVDSIEATGDWEVTVHMSSPDSLWQYIPATSGCQITSEAYYEAHKDNFGNADGGTIGTGAYKYVSWDSGSQIVLEKNEYYWGDAPAFDKVIYNVISDPSAMALAATSGQVDLIVSPSIDTISTYESSSAVTVHTEDGLNNTLISFNCQKAPFDDVNVRRAVASAIDSATICQSQMGDYASVGTALPFSNTVYGLDQAAWQNAADTLPAYDYDMDQAKTYLAQSGYADGFDCTMVTLNDTTYNNIAQAIQYSLKELNINMEIKQVTTSEYYAYAYGGMITDGIRDYDIMINRWTPDYCDPAGYLNPQYSSANTGDGGSNYAAYSNAQVDELIAAQLASTDNAERSALMLEAFGIIADEEPYKPLYYPKVYWITSSRCDYELAPFWLYNVLMKDVQKLS